MRRLAAWPAAVLLLAGGVCAQTPHGHGWWNGRAVEYVVRDGMAVVGGDILLGPVSGGAKGAGRERSSPALNFSSGLWPGKTVIYQIDSGLPNPSRVTEAIAVWEAKTSIRFRQRTTETGYVRIQRGNGGCSSNVGYLPEGSFVVLADECSLGNTIHELGHTIGLLHTQDRADRDRNVRVMYENIDKGIAQFYNFEYNQALVDTVDIGPYDYSSIMHYPLGGYSRGPRPAMVTTPAGIPVGQRDGLSPGDVQVVQRLYGESVQGVTITTNPPGMAVTVDGETITSTRTYDWKAGETHLISAVGRKELTAGSRYEFAKWSDGGAREHTVTVTAGQTLFIANYARQFLVETAADPANGGTVRMIPESEDGFYPEGVLLRLKAVAAADVVRFLNWGGSEALSENWQGNAANATELVVRREGLKYVARFVTDSVPVTTITSEPEGAEVTVDGTTIRTPFQVVWTAGSTHTIAAADRQSHGIGSYMVFSGWSDGGAASHTITSPGSSTVWTATMTQRFSVGTALSYLSTPGVAVPTAGQNITVTPLSGMASSDGFYDAGTVLEFRATSAPGVPFTNWYGDLAGAVAVQQLVVKEQTQVTANFQSAPYFGELGLVNGASLQPRPASPGALTLLYRAGIGPETDIVLSADASGQYPLAVNGVSVFFGTTPVQLLRLSHDNVMFLVPAGVDQAQSISLTLQAPVGSYRTTVPAAAVSPGLFTVDFSGRGQALAVNEDGTANGANAAAAPGQSVLLLMTGIGAISADAIPPLAVEAGGIPATVTTVLGTDSPGTFGIVAQLSPDTPVGEIPVVLFVRGTRSQYNVTIQVK